jgi:predicted lactoylglutathione lyase
MPQSVCLEAAPYLLVDDVVVSSHYWRDVLGFKFDTYFGDPPVFVIMRRQSVSVMLRQVPSASKPAQTTNTDKLAEALDLYIWVSDVASLHKEYVTNGATIINPPEAEGDRLEMLVADNNGYVLCFGEVRDWRG